MRFEFYFWKFSSFVFLNWAFLPWLTKAVAILRVSLHCKRSFAQQFSGQETRHYSRWNYGNGNLITHKALFSKGFGPQEQMKGKKSFRMRLVFWQVPFCTWISVSLTLFARLHSKVISYNSAGCWHIKVYKSIYVHILALKLNKPEL